MSPNDFEYGVKLDCGGIIIHGQGANVKHPFENIPVVMHEMSPGKISEEGVSSASFGGQLGFIEFTTEMRLPRHVHIGPNKATHPGSEQRLLVERILVLNGFAMVEMCGELYIIPPKSLVHIPAGVPHTWTACPKGVDLNSALNLITQEEIMADGTFLMIYEYEDPTSFCPTKQKHVLKSVDEYQRASDKELEGIMIPELSANEVNERCWFAWERQIKRHARYDKSEEE